MQKRKAKDASSDGDWKSGSASFKSGSRSGAGGVSGSEVLVPSGTNIVWQLEEEAKNAWHVYTDEVQVRTNAIHRIKKSVCCFDDSLISASNLNLSGSHLA